MLEGPLRDVSHGWRALRRRPGFLIGAVGTLALGIGANTAMFGVVDAVLLAPLPYPKPNELVSFEFQGRKNPEERSVFSVADWQDAAPQLSAFRYAAAYTDSQFTISGEGGEPEQVRGVWGTSDLLPTIGVSPAMGRWFTTADDKTEGDRQVVLSYEYFERRFGGNADVIGRSIAVNGRHSTVVGVMPRGFQFPIREAVGSPGSIAFWIRHPSDPATRRGPYYLHGVGRLAEKTSLAQAQAQLSTIGAQIAAAHPESNAELTFGAKPLKDVFVGSSRLTMYALFVATGLILLIAAANVSNLLLARGAARQRELAIRVAQGASPKHILQQLLAEGAVLAALGAIGGALLAAIALRVLVAIGPTDVPRLSFASVDARVLAFNAVVAALCAVGFGLLPARRATRMDAYDALRSSACSTAPPEAGRMRRLLVAAEVALSFVVLVATGLLVNSLYNLQSVKPGVVRPEQVLSLQVDLPTRRYGDGPTINAFYDAMVERAAALPGVVSAGSGMSLPPNRLSITDNFTIEGEEPKTGNFENAVPLVFVDETYFATLGVPVLRGRAFTKADAPGTPGVAIVNAEFAARHFPNTDPIGRRFRTGGAERPDNPYMTIVGVVGNLHYSGVERAADPAFFLPFSQNQWNDNYLVLRTRGDPYALIEPVRQMIRQIDPELAITDVRTMQERFDLAIGAPRFRSVLFAAFGVLGLILAGVGLYAVTSTIVSERTREIGVRMVLGASAGKVVAGVLGGALRNAALGLVVGAIAAGLAMHLLQKLLFGLSPLDPATYAAAAAVLLGTCALAAWLPARRAALADPMRALRDE
jgi:predicted permease